jgi:molecular chaperone DnaK (HSP70)
VLDLLRNLARRLTAKRNRDWIACLDFGTAYSKMAMVLSEAREDLEPEDIRPLPIGVGGSSVGEYLLPSVIFVAKSAVLFGSEAQDAAFRQSSSGREALQAPKQYLSTQDLAELDAPLTREIDPTGGYTPRKLITLYLAFLLLRAEKGAREARLPWPPRLRIARPAWQEDRARAGEEALQAMVRNAFFLADVLETELGRPEGLPHTAASAAFDKLEKTDLSALPWENEVFALSRNGEATVLEATAVAAGSIRPQGRRIVVVADIGGGTSDFAAFMTGLPGRNVVAELINSSGVLRQAGDHIDMLLRSFILSEAGYLADDPAARGPSLFLRLRQRALKEDLFEQGRIAVELNDQFVEVTLEDFLKYPPVQRFSQSLREKFGTTLDSAIDAARSYVPGSQMPIEIMLTGGGYKLPMVHALARDPQRSWRFVEAAPELAGLSPNAAFVRVARQLAVAIGGAVRDLPIQTAPISS